MRIVVDTNVLISGIFFGGFPRRILTSIINKQLTACATTEIINEYEEIVEEMIDRKQKHLNRAILAPLIQTMEILRDRPAHFFNHSNSALITMILGWVSYRDCHLQIKTRLKIFLIHSCRPFSEKPYAPSGFHCSCPFTLSRLFIFYGTDSLLGIPYISEMHCRFLRTARSRNSR